MRLSELDLDGLLAHVLANATNLSSRLHGENHWLRVTKVGLELTKQVPDCDLTVIFLFGLLHDTQRLCDGHDPQHGERASHFVQRMNNGVFLLADEQLKILAYALHEHDTGKISDDPTIGICWDADRLNLWRIGRVPRQPFLSTDPAKTWSMRLRALSYQYQSYTWQDLYQEFVTLSRKNMVLVEG